jgi:hypothetical protein
MISEQEFSFEKNTNDILKKLYETGVYEESDKAIIKYYGNKNKIPLEEEGNKSEKSSENGEYNNIINPEEGRNTLVINFNNIYIGGISINDIFKRENFGLNIYSEDSFYIGRWKENMKQGIGFLKINENLMYAGNFSYNQINGFGILYNKLKQTLIFGEFNNGELSEGVFYNIENGYFYRGKIKDGMKNGKVCTFNDAKKGYLFLGEIVNDEFKKGYTYFIKIEEGENEEEDNINFAIDKTVYFDGLGADNKIFYSDGSLKDELQDIAKTIIDSDLNLKDNEQKYLDYFNELNTIINEDCYYNVEYYNSLKDEQFIEKNFIDNYYNVLDSFQAGQEGLKLEKYEEIIQHPETKTN